MLVYLAAMEQLLIEIEDFCERWDISVTEFGLKSLNDRSLVTGIRRGRDLRLSTVDKIRRFMAMCDKIGRIESLDD